MNRWVHIVRGSEKPMLRHDDRKPDKIVEMTLED